MKKTYSTEYELGDKVCALLENEIIHSEVHKIRITIQAPYRNNKNKLFNGIQIEYLIGKSRGENSTEFFWNDEDNISKFKSVLINKIA